jgi:hypothetical protein
MGSMLITEGLKMLTLSRVLMLVSLDDDKSNASILTCLSPPNATIPARCQIELCEGNSPTHTWNDHRLVELDAIRQPEQ